MVYSSIISALVLLIVLAQIHFIGKYISTKQDMFTNNKFATFVLGFITYFAITFAVLFIFIFFKLPIIYSVVFFVVKDVIQIMFLLARREVFNGKINWHVWRDAAIGAIVITGITVFFNYIAPLIQPIRDNHSYMSFQSWYKFQDIISKVTVIKIDFIYHWFGSLLVTALGYASVMAFISNFSKKVYWWYYIFGSILTLLMIFGFSFGKTIESQAGSFLILFAIMVAVNIIVFSRRRYATVYGLTTIAAWSFNQYLILAFILIAFVTLTIYAILQKPKASMFWVQLMAPIALVSTFLINDFSRPLGLAVSIIAVLLYAFMVSIGQVKILERLDQFFLKMRYVIPIVIFLGIMVSAIAIATTSTTASSNILANDITYLFYTYHSDMINYIQIGFYSALVAMIIIYLVYTFFFKKKLLKTQLVAIICSLIILFALNPAFWILLKDSVMEEQFKYISMSILPPLLIVGFTRIHTIRENKTVIFI